MRSTPYMSSFVSATTLHIVARTRLERSSGGFFFFVNVSERRSSAADLVGRSGKIVWLGGGNRQKRPDADAKRSAADRGRGRVGDDSGYSSIWHGRMAAKPSRFQTDLRNDDGRPNPRDCREEGTSEGGKRAPMTCPDEAGPRRGRTGRPFR